MASIESYLSRAVERGRMSPGDKAATMARIRGTTELEDLSDCDMVIEAVTEKPDLKKEIIRKLGRICRPDIILCTNTSTVSVTDLSGSSPNPEKVIGTHFLSPVPPSKLVEIIRTDITSAETVEIIREFCKSLGKEIIVAKDTPLFVFNYLYTALTQAALELLENDVATAEDIDKTMTLGLGHPLGPIALVDFNGVDTIYLVFKAAYDQTKDLRHKPSEQLKRLYEEGRLGRKTGRGFYEYG